MSMTRETYIASVLASCRLVEVLSTKNEGKVLRLRNQKAEKDLILRSYPRKVYAYEALLPVRCRNLPEVYDVVDLADGQIVLEEFIPGIPLDQTMEMGKLNRLGARRIMVSLCHAMEVLHSRQLVHRDIKPENVMLREDGTVVLIDLNAARQQSDASHDTVVMGTVGYVSPEQLGLSQSDSRTDIYAAGVLYNVMLTGKHPTEAFARGRAGRIIRKCTALNPADRYPTAAKLRTAL